MAGLVWVTETAGCTSIFELSGTAWGEDLSNWSYAPFIVTEIQFDADANNTAPDVNGNVFIELGPGSWNVNVTLPVTSSNDAANSPYVDWVDSGTFIEAGSAALYPTDLVPAPAVIFGTASFTVPDGTTYILRIGFDGPTPESALQLAEGGTIITSGPCYVPEG